MKIEYYNQGGYSQIEVKFNCEYEDFYHFADKLSELLGISYKKKFEDFDDIYWDFNFEGAEMTLTYNVYLGVAICPHKFKNATESDYQKLTKLLEVLNSSDLNL